MKTTMIGTTLCILVLVHVTTAMYGLCSTQWFPKTKNDWCNDNNDECKEAGGRCYHPGVGDSGDGCVCLRNTTNPATGKLEYILLNKDHLHGKGKRIPKNFKINHRSLN